MTPRPVRQPVRQSPARRALVQMMGAVIVVHVVAIAIYRLAGIPQRPERVGRLFGIVWTAVTVAVVAVGLFRIRAAQRASRAARGL